MNEQYFNPNQPVYGNNPKNYGENFQNMNNLNPQNTYGQMPNPQDYAQTPNCQNNVPANYQPEYTQPVDYQNIPYNNQTQEDEFKRKFKPEAYIMMPPGFEPSQNPQPQETHNLSGKMQNPVYPQMQSTTYPQSQILAYPEMPSSDMSYPKMEESYPTSGNKILRGQLTETEMNERIKKIEKTQKPKGKNVVSALVKGLCPAIITVCVIAACIILMKSFIFDVNKVSGTSMLPTYKNNDVIDVQKWEYYVKSPMYGDVVVAKLDDGESIIKRIVACPGDTLYISGGNLYVNDTLQETEFEPMNEAGIASSIIILGDDEYFVLGDNRNGSTDSRSSKIGVINKNQIQGKVERILPKWMGVFG